MFLYRFASGHRVASRSHRKPLRDKGYKNVFFLPLGINISDYAFNERKFFHSKFRIVYIASLDLRKGLDRFIRVLLYVNKLGGRDLNNIEFNVIASRELKSYIRRLLGRFGLNMVIVPRMPRYVYTNYLKNMHLGIITSYAETFNMFGLENLAVGNPVISFNIPGPNEYIINDKSGFLIREGDYRSFAKK